MSANGNHAVSSAQPVWLRQVVRLLDDGQRARGLRAVRGERDSVQSRIAAARRDFREPENHASGSADLARAAAKTVPRQSGWRTRLGLRAGIRRRDLANVA